MWVDKRPPLARMPEPQSLSDLYCYLKGQKDDTSGTYTGAAGGLIENPVDIFRHAAVFYGNGLNATTDFNVSSGGSVTLGSFVQACTDLNALLTGDYKLSVCQTEPIDICEDFRREIQRHCPGLMIYRSKIDGKWQAVLYQASPSAEKLYHTAFSWEKHISHEHPFSMRETDASEICSRVYVSYRYSIPQSIYTKTAFISAAASDDGDGNTDATRVAAAVTRESNYGMKNTWEDKFPWIADTNTAVALRNYIFDRSGPLWSVTFTTFLNGADLQKGHVISFNADVDAHVVFPKYGGTTTWESKLFQVTQIRRISKDDAPELYTINAMEV